jgi:hypothetical protein
MRSKGLGARASALVLGAVVAALTMPGAALAARPTATTGGAANVTFQSARVNGSVDANNEATNYYFQYGTTRAYGTETAMTPVGSSGAPVRVSTDLGGLAPATRYHYRIVARNGSGVALGGDRTFTTRRQPLGVSLAATPNPIKVGDGTTLAGTLSGTGNANRRVVLQSNPWPYTQGFRDAANPQVTNAQGGFSFPLLSVPFNTQYRVQMPERPQVVSPIVTVGVRQHISTKVSKHRVRRGRRIRFSGRVSPARVGAQIAFQKKRGSTWVTVGGTIVHTGGRYARRVKIRRGGTFRVWTGVLDQQYTSTAGRSVRIRTFR